MITPKDSFVLVLREEAKSQTKGGLFIPDIAKNKPGVGIVAFLPENGKGDLKLNDKVIFSAFAGTEIKYQEKEYILINVDDIHALVE